MKTFLFFAFASGILSAARGSVPPAGTGEISVRLYNLSGIHPATLDRASQEASRIFAQAGVNVLWETGDPEAQEAHETDQSAAAAFRDRRTRNYLVVRVGRGLAVHVPSAALGVSLPHAQFGVSVTVFQERVESLCQSAGLDFAAMLGHAIAHELGHVTLGTDAHAAAGIMRARWGMADFEQAASGRLGFTPQERARIRDYAERLPAAKEPPRGPGLKN